VLLPDLGIFRSGVDGGRNKHRSPLGRAEGQGGNKAGLYIAFCCALLACNGGPGLKSYVVRCVCSIVNGHAASPLLRKFYEPGCEFEPLATALEPQSHAPSYGSFFGGHTGSHFGLLARPRVLALN